MTALQESHAALASELVAMGQHCQQLLALGDSYSGIVATIRTLEAKITAHMDQVSAEAEPHDACFVWYLHKRVLYLLGTVKLCVNQGPMRH